MLNRFYGAFDTERRSGACDGSDYRTPFQIDRDRVLHTPTFRRLQNKTQVFFSDANKALNVSLDRKNKAF